MPEHPAPSVPVADDTTMFTLLLDLREQLGRIEGTQIGLITQATNAETSRAALHSKLDAVSEKATAAAHRAELAVSHAEQAVSAAQNMKPAVDDYVTMKGYAKAGLYALGLVVMPLLGLLGYGVVQLWNLAITHLDLSRLWTK